jgi:hypothetical protein
MHIFLKSQSNYLRKVAIITTYRKKKPPSKNKGGGSCYPYPMQYGFQK